jgi:hypothetical protein
MNIENATAEELISELMNLAILSYHQYQLYPDGSLEQKQILQAQRIPAELLIILQESEESCDKWWEKNVTLDFVKEALIEEQNKRLKEAELSQQFLNGDMECTIQA